MKATPALTAVTLLLLACTAQAQSDPGGLVIRITVNLVQVDAVVFDAKGKPVTDLEAKDFELLQDGRAQHLTNFSYISTEAGLRTAVAAGSRGAGKKPNSPPPAVLKLTDIRRTFALVVDDLGLSLDSMARVRQSLTRFVDAEMRPGDLVAIVRTGGGMGALQQFTSDKRMLHTAIERLRFNGMGRVGTGSFAPVIDEPGMGRPDADAAVAQLGNFRQAIFTMGTLGAIRFVIDGLRDLPGRKSLVVFSEDLQMGGGRRLTDAANRASVVIYTIDPRGLQSQGLTAQDATGYKNQAQLRQIPGARAQQEWNSGAGLATLAASTGGLFLQHANDLDGSLRTVIHDSNGYYLLGYQPSSGTFDKKQHTIAVRVKRPGLHVRSRSGFVGEPDGQPAVTPQGRQAEIAHALRSPFAASGIRVRLTPLFTTSPKTGAYLKTLLYIDSRDLQFTDEADGWHQAVIDLVAVTFGENGEAADTTNRTYTVRARSPLYEGSLKNGLLYSVIFPVKNPGAYQMRAVVRDQNSARMGSANQFVDVPDVKQGRLTVTSIVLQERAEAVGQPQGEGQLEQGNPQGSAAVRSFTRGALLEYQYEILNAQGDAGGLPEIESQTLLFRDGQEIYAGKSTLLGVAGQLNPKQVQAGGNLTLKEGIGPGDYVLQIVVTDKRAPAKYRTASQWVDFQVQ